MRSCITLSRVIQWSDVEWNWSKKVHVGTLCPYVDIVRNQKMYWPRSEMVASCSLSSLIGWEMIIYMTSFVLAWVNGSPSRRFFWSNFQFCAGLLSVVRRDIELLCPVISSVSLVYFVVIKLIITLFLLQSYNVHISGEYHAKEVCKSAGLSGSKAQEVLLK